MLHYINIKKKKGGKETPYNTHHTTPTCQNYIRACGNIEATKARLSLGYKTTGGCCGAKNDSPQDRRYLFSQKPRRLLPNFIRGGFRNDALAEAQSHHQRSPEGGILGAPSAGPTRRTRNPWAVRNGNTMGKRSRHPNPTALVKVQHSRETHEMEEGATCLNQIRIGFRCKHVLKGPKSP